MAGFILTIDGFPYKLATNGITSVTSSEDDWPTGSTLLTGYLEWPDVTITEEMKLTTGDVEISGLSLKIHDKEMTVDGATRNPITYLCTRDEDNLPKVTLAASAAATGNITVANPTTISSYIPGVLWVENEAINCSSINTSTGVVTVSNRGYYGTVAKAHTLDAASPTRTIDVFAAFPYIKRRRVLLWYTPSSGAVTDATVVWRGFADRPRLTPEGVLHELRCEHVWKIYKNARLGSTQTACRIRGFDVRTMRGTMLYNVVGRERTSDPVRKVYSNLEGAVNDVASTLETQMAADVTAVATTFDGHVTSTVDERGAGIQVVTENNQYLGATFSIGELYGWDNAETTVGNTLFVNPRVIPPKASVLVPTAGGEIPIDRTDLLSTTASTTYSYDSINVTTSVTLRGKFKDKFIVIRPATGSPITANSTNFEGPTYNGVLTFEAEGGSGDATQEPYFEDNGYQYIDQPVSLQQVQRVESEHFVYAWRDILSSSHGGSLLQHNFDDRDFNLDALQLYAGLTSDSYPARAYEFDGTKTVDAMLLPELVLTGGCMSVRSKGRLRYIPITRPTLNDTVVTITSTSLAKDSKPTWAKFEDIINTSKLSTKGFTLNVVDSISASRYGEGKRLEVDISGFVDPGLLADRATAIGSGVFARLFALYRKQLDVVTLPLKDSFWNQIYLGTVVSFTEWLTPNSSGTRGNSARRGVCVRRSRDLRSGVLTIDVLCLPTGLGYSPCIKIASISTATITADQNYVGSTDYADSESAEYQGTANDRGVGWFQAGDRVKIVKRNTTSTIEETGLVVQSVSTASKTITLTTSPSTTISSDWYDLIYDNYNAGGVQSTQKANYAWVGGNSQIASSGTLQEWQP